MEKVINDLKNSLNTRALDLLRNEVEIEKDKAKLRAYWRGIMHMLDLSPDESTYRWGYGIINLLPD